MAQQSLIWTTLPNGYSEDGKSLRLSVLLSPRLDPQNNANILKSFPDFVDWPATLSQAEFKVILDGQSVAVHGSQLSGNSRIDDSLGTADSTIWQALFPDKTFVRSYKFKDLSADKILSYDTLAMSALLRNLYNRLARISDEQLPTVSALFNEPHWKQVIDTVRTNDRRYMDKSGMRDISRQFDQFAQGFEDMNELAQNLVRTQLFHTPLATPEVQKYQTTPADPKSKAQWRTYKRGKFPAKKTDFAKEIDFHQMVAAMNQYPTLLRKLGLVVDLLVEASAFSLSNQQTLQIAVELPPGTGNTTRTPDANPFTKTSLTKRRFAALPRPVPQLGDFQVHDGLLHIDPKQYRLLQADVDGGSLKLMNFARSLDRHRLPNKRLDPVTRFERQVGAPSLRTAGLMLVHRNRGSMLHNSLQKAKNRNDALEKIHQGVSSTPPELFAEDLVRGFRIDIWDKKTEIWRSLCQRASNYTIADLVQPIMVESEEGMVRLAATKSADDTSNQDVVSLHEALLSWTGWSLCVPAPGNTIDKNDNISDGETEVPPGLRLRTEFKALKHSLPRLRFGREYWLRARAVDLAGNSLLPRGEDFGGEDPQTNATAFLRYEPVAGPAITLVKVKSSGDVLAPQEGESMERMGIRSFNDKPADNVKLTEQVAARFAVPVQSSVKEAEQHGMLDAAGTLDATAFALLAAQDNALAEVKLDAGGPLSSANGSKAGYAVFEESGELPYLPDPLLVEFVARIFDHPAISDKDLITIPVYLNNNSWPHALPFKIQVYEDKDKNKQAKFDTTRQTLFVPLPKAVRASLRLSAKLSNESLKILGIWNWLSSADQHKLEKKALNGQHWMLTPWRTVELVHAVQRPLIDPDIYKNVLLKGLYKTYVIPRFITSLSIKSTAHIDLQAHWHEPQDIASEKIGANRERHDHAFSVKITDDKSYATWINDPNFTSTPEHQIIGEDTISVGKSFDDKVSPKIHEFNDTRYRRIEYWLEATTRFREYMPAHLLTKDDNGNTVATDENIKVIGPKVVDWIPNSSPPPAPEVLYVIPTFGWVRTKTAAGESSWRRGGGLRVYLDRPWCVTGYGEMLAVVLPDVNFGGDPNDTPANQPIKKFVTQWGNDPAWNSTYVKGVAPTRADFPLARNEPDAEGKWLPSFAPVEEADQPAKPFEVTDLTHPALATAASSARVDIAPHDVFYDKDRRLWYCDLEINCNNSYYPFIRLALARYQPVSVSGAHLSNIVQADFMPLAPDRWLNVNHTDIPYAYRVNVYGSTYSNSSGAEEAKHAPMMSHKLLTGGVIVVKAADVSPRSIIEVWVEKLDQALGEDFGWQREENAIIKQDKKTPMFRPVPVNKPLIAQKRLYMNRQIRKRNFAQVMKDDLVAQVLRPPTLWQGTVSLPGTATDKDRYRLVIAEYEEYFVDDPSPYNPIPTEKGRRLVFVEHMTLQVEKIT